MKIQVITLFGEMIEGYFDKGVLSRGLKKGSFSLETINPRDFTEDNHKTVDDSPYGGFDGMLMKAEPLKRAIESLENPGKIVHFSAQGKPWSHELCEAWSKEPVFTFICSRYAGVDQRFIEKCVDEEVSVGDFIVTGGELPCLLVLDSLLRSVPGVLGNKDSFYEESFAKDGLLECPQWTRPRDWEGLCVPDVCVSGDHKKIKEFQQELSFLRTYFLRPDLLKTPESRETLRALALKFSQMQESELQACGLKQKDLKLLL